VIRTLTPTAILLVTTLVALTATACGGSPTIRVTVDDSMRYQTIDGWAATTRYWEEDKEHDRFDRSFEPYAERIAEFLVDQIGINMVRLELLSGFENPHDYWGEFVAGRIGYREYAKYRFEKVNDNDDPHSVNTAGFQFGPLDYRIETSVLPLRRALEARGERLWINVCYVDFKSNAAAGATVQGPFSHARDPQEYAEFILTYLRRMRDKYALVPDSLEIVLEPDGTADWRGADIGRALVTTADLLRANGFAVEMFAPSNASMANAISYFDDMIQVPGVAERLDTFVYHRYRLQRRAYVEEIRARAQRYNLKTAMLEKLNGTIDMLLEDLTVGHVASWQLWGAAGHQRSAPNANVYALVDDRSPAAPVITRAHRSDELAHVFRYVRRGAVRIAASSTPSRNASAAFINPDGTRVVVVRTSSGTRTVSIVGLPAGRYESRFTGDGAPHGDPQPLTTPASGEVTIPVSGKGTLTVYGVRPGKSLTGS
jgi:hypothetical protein